MCYFWYCSSYWKLGAAVPQLFRNIRFTKGVPNVSKSIYHSCCPSIKFNYMNPYSLIRPNQRNWLLKGATTFMQVVIFIKHRFLVKHCNFSIDSWSIRYRVIFGEVYRLNCRHPFDRYVIFPLNLLWTFCMNVAASCGIAFNSVFQGVSVRGFVGLNL